jgi:hypothetical protein
VSFLQIEIGFIAVRPHHRISIAEAFVDTYVDVDVPLTGNEAGVEPRGRRQFVPQLVKKRARIKVISVCPASCGLQVSASPDGVAQVHRRGSRRRSSPVVPG